MIAVANATAICSLRQVNIIAKRKIFRIMRIIINNKKLNLLLSQNLCKIKNFAIKTKFLYFKFEKQRSFKPLQASLQLLVL